MYHNFSIVSFEVIITLLLFFRSLFPLQSWVDAYHISSRNAWCSLLVPGNIGLGLLWVAVASSSISASNRCWRRPEFVSLSSLFLTKDFLLQAAGNRSKWGSFSLQFSLLDNSFWSIFLFIKLAFVDLVVSAYSLSITAARQHFKYRQSTLPWHKESERLHCWGVLHEEPTPVSLAQLVGCLGNRRSRFYRGW